MIVSMSIKDLAVIEATSMEFGPGLTVLTGETGAGKSIIIAALSLLLGDRAQTDAIRRGADRAEVEGLFRLAPHSRAAAELEALDLGFDDDEQIDGAITLLIRRVISRTGRGRVYINGRLATVANLRAVSQGLVDITSQHQHTQLLDDRHHLAVLDRFGGLDEGVAEFRQAYEIWREAARARDELRSVEAKRLQREDFVRFQLQELDDLNPQDGERARLVEERSRLAHADKLASASASAGKDLCGGRDTADAALRRAIRALDDAGGVDAALDALRERVETARIDLEDASHELAMYSRNVDADPRRLAETDDRIAAIRKLERKHGADEGGLVAITEALRAEVDTFESLEINIQEAEALVTTTEAAARVLAEGVSQQRKVAAAALEERVTEELAALAMPDAKIRFELEPRPTLAATGVDSGSLSIETNRGEGFGPIGKVASGGELSRVLLALKRALSHADPVETCIFDEIDTGTGGAVADAIGRQLAALADERQVMVITHLAQVAARANHHLKVDKTVVGDRTTTSVETLDAKRRHDEIARMLGGLEITKKTRDHAAELLSR